MSGNIGRVIWDRLHAGYVVDENSVTYELSNAKLCYDDDIADFLSRDTSGEQYVVHGAYDLAHSQKENLTLITDQATFVKIRLSGQDSHSHVILGSQTHKDLLNSNSIESSEYVGHRYYWSYKKNDDQSQEFEFSNTWMDALKAAFQYARMQQYDSDGTDLSFIRAFEQSIPKKAFLNNLRTDFMPQKVFLNEAILNHPHNLDRTKVQTNFSYLFLKSPRVTQRAADIEPELPMVNGQRTFPYSLDDERCAIEQSKNNPNQTFLLISAGRANKKSVVMSLTDVTSTKSIAEAIHEICESVSSIERNSDITDSSMLQFSVNGAIAVSAFYDETADTAHVRMLADETLVTARNILDAKKLVISKMEDQGYYGLVDERSTIHIGRAKLPFHVDVPANPQSFAADHTHPIQDGYAQFGLCHIYKKGACIARVSLDNPDSGAEHILFTHPRDGVEFTDLSHAESYAFGISNKINDITAKAFGIGCHQPSSMHHLIDEVIRNSQNGEMLFSNMLATVASKHGLSVEQVKDAFWDAFSGKVFGSDLRCEPIKSLFTDIVQNVGIAFEQAKPITDLWICRLEDLENGISPDVRQSLNENSALTKARFHEPLQREFKSPYLRR